MQRQIRLLLLAIVDELLRQKFQISAFTYARIGDLSYNEAECKKYTLKGGDNHDS